MKQLILDFRWSGLKEDVRPQTKLPLNGSQYFCFIDTFQHRCLRVLCLTSSERVTTGFSLISAGFAGRHSIYYTFYYILWHLQPSARWSCRCPPTTCEVGSLGQSIGRTFKIRVLLGNLTRGKPYIPKIVWIFTLTSDGRKHHTVASSHNRELTPCQHSG